MTRPASSEVPAWSKRRIALFSLGVALAVAIVGFASTSLWLSSARDPSCGDSDCDQGAALVALFFIMVSFVISAVSGAGAGAILVVRHRPKGQRGRAIRRAAVVAALPLAIFALLLFAAI